jgi:HEAT repeat protein
MAFVKGQSGNPGGRPKEVADVKALARVHTEMAIAVLVEIAKDKKKTANARVSAVCALLDRGYGKPAQALEHSGEIKTGIGELLEAIDGRTRGLPNGG